jgi:serine/threonine protein kinase
VALTALEYFILTIRALSIARHTADALEAVHKKGIVHRDWQPGNIKIKADDAVKVLDFGLAEVAEPTLREGSPEEPPTLTFQAAREEVIPGRAA